MGSRDESESPNPDSATALLGPFSRIENVILKALHNRPLTVLCSQDAPVSTLNEAACSNPQMPDPLHPSDEPGDQHWCDIPDRGETAAEKSFEEAKGITAITDMTESFNVCKPMCASVYPSTNGPICTPPGRTVQCHDSIAEDLGLLQLDTSNSEPHTLAQSEHNNMDNVRTSNQNRPPVVHPFPNMFDIVGRAQSPSRIEKEKEQMLDKPMTVVASSKRPRGRPKKKDKGTATPKSGVQHTTLTQNSMLEAIDT